MLAGALSRSEPPNGSRADVFKMAAINQIGAAKVSISLLTYMAPAIAPTDSA